MITDNKYRWDFIGLSTDDKPTPATSDRVVDGSTFYCSDTSKLYVFCKDTWYEKEATGGTTYTAGDNITIADGVISATDTTYNNFTGTDGTDPGTAGLVPAPAATDADKFLKSDGTWDTAGGGGPTVVQTSGTSTTDVMSQNAVSSMVFADPGTNSQVQIGHAFATGGTSIAIGGNTDSGGESSATQSTSIAIGYGAKANGNGSISIGSKTSSSNTRTVCIGGFAKSEGNYSVAIGGGSGTSSGAYASSENSISIGANSHADASKSVALGAGAYARYQGEVNISTHNVGNNGYNYTEYRLLTGLYDGQSLHDAATVAQGNTLATTAPTTSTVGVLGQLYTDTTNMHTYQCTAINNGEYTWTQRW